VRPVRRTALAIATTLGTVGGSSVALSAPLPQAVDAPVDPAPAGAAPAEPCATTTTTTTTTVPSAVPGAAQPFAPATPDTSTATTTTSTTTTTTSTTTTTVPDTAVPPTTVPDTTVAPTTVDPATTVPPATDPCAVVDTTVPPTDGAVPDVPADRLPTDPATDPAVTDPAAVDPATTEPPAADLPTEPTGPLPPVNPAWLTTGGAASSTPWIPGSTALFPGRTPAGERRVLVDDVDVILATIRQVESAGRYGIGPNRAQASGAYQFIPSTWNNFAGYAEAYLAPPEVQDLRARIDVIRFLTEYDGDVSMVPIMWYYPRAATDASWLDRVPNPAGGNRLTIREYQTLWLDRLATNATVMLGAAVAGLTTPAQVSVLSDLPMPEPIVDPLTGAIPEAAVGTVAPAAVQPPAMPPAVVAPAVEPAPDGSAPAPDGSLPVELPVTLDEVTLPESTIDLAARAAPPSLGEQGVGSMRTIAFPVLGPVDYVDGWGDARDGGLRRHEGTDIVGVSMQPILAAVDGVVVRAQHTSVGISGVAIAITDADGWRYNYFHANNDTPGTDDGAAADAFRIAPGLEVGDTVEAGQIIGYMGDSGNSELSVSHLHFEMRDPTGQARPSFWSLRAAQANQACTIGIGPWSTPEAGDALTTDEAIEPTVATPVAELAVEQPLVHTVVTPLFGTGQWIIDSEGRVTATGDAALITAGRDAPCDPGPRNPFGTDAAGWGALDADVLLGTVLQDVDLTGTVLERVIPVDPTITVPADDAADPAVEPATDPALVVPPTDAPPVDAPALVVAPIDATATAETPLAPYDPIRKPMTFVDSATGETIIVVFELPGPPLDRVQRMHTAPL
jgi:murein DD-endopeptidase MepM/ murein hydrolase activator NlpD